MTEENYKNIVLELENCNSNDELQTVINNIPDDELSKELQYEFLECMKNNKSFEDTLVDIKVVLESKYEHSKEEIDEESKVL